MKFSGNWVSVIKIIGFRTTGPTSCVSKSSNMNSINYLPRRQSFFCGSTHSDISWFNGIGLNEASGYRTRHVASSNKTNFRFARHFENR